jgi:hypothetical protein
MTPCTSETKLISLYIMYLCGLLMQPGHIETILIRRISAWKKIEYLNCFSHAAELLRMCNWTSVIIKLNFDKIELLNFLQSNFPLVQSKLLLSININFHYGKKNPTKMQILACSRWIDAFSASELLRVAFLNCLDSAPELPWVMPIGHVLWTAPLVYLNCQVKLLNCIVGAPELLEVPLAYTSFVCALKLSGVAVLNLSS